jgi:hypothetical protein
MKRKRRSREVERSDPKKADERSGEVTGDDASPDEAEAGNVGYGEAAGYPDDIERQFRLEGDPSRAEDISPDEYQRDASNPPEEDREYTARPKPEEDVHPIPPDLLPTQDPDANNRR